MQKVGVLDRRQREATLEERIGRDLVAAVKSGDRLTVATLRLVRAAAKNQEVARRRPLTDEEWHEVLRHQAKMRREAIAGFEQGNRPEQAEQERAELTVLQAYLPQQLGDEEIRAALAGAIAATGATGPGDLGRVMAAAMPSLRGRADGATVNRLARQMLASETTA